MRRQGAAGHRKGPIDGMSNFGVKFILCRDVVSLDQWHVDS